MMALGDAQDLPGQTRYVYLVEFVVLGSGVIGVFAVIFLFYTNSFLMKRRTRELGLYHILGMGKRHIAKMLFFETLYIALIGILGGVACGLLFQKLATLLLCKTCTLRCLFWLLHILGGNSNHMPAVWRDSAGVPDMELAPDSDAEIH